MTRLAVIVSVALVGAMSGVDAFTGESARVKVLSSSCKEVFCNILPIPVTS